MKEVGETYDIQKTYKMECKKTKEFGLVVEAIGNFLHDKYR